MRIIKRYNYGGKMGILRSAFGPSKGEIWTQIATDIGGEFIEGG